MAIDYNNPLFAFPKSGAIGARAERVEKSHQRQVAEQTNKRIAKKADQGRCRWPHQTPEEKRLCDASPKEMAHWPSKGMGGDHGKRSDPTKLIRVCEPTHKGPRKSFHAGDRRPVPLDKAQGLRGPCRFEEKRGGRWVVVGEETSVGIFKR